MTTIISRKAKDTRVYGPDFVMEAVNKAISNMIGLSHHTGLHYLHGLMLGLKHAEVIDADVVLISPCGFYYEVAFKMGVSHYYTSIRIS